MQILMQILEIFVWFIAIGLICAVVYFLYRLKNYFAQGPLRSGAVKNFNSHEDVTTVLPPPLAASMCNHKWDILCDKVLDMPHEKRTVLIVRCIDCGVLDKTVQSTSKMPEMPVPPIPPCLHEWESVVQQNMEMAHEKKVVVILTCRKCGQIDKTVESTSKVPTVWVREDCCHEWVTEKRIVLDSAYEQFHKGVKSNGKAKDVDLDDLPPWMFKKTFISIRICKTCGQLDKTIASNFEGGEPADEEDDEE